MAAAGTAIFVFVYKVSAPAAVVDGPVGRAPLVATTSPVPAAAAAPTASPVARVADMDRRTYAVSVVELAGLPPDAAPGTRLHLWVMWRPPLVRKPRLQPLIADVILEKVVPPVTPEGSHVALLSVPGREAPDLLWADQFGELSVTLPHP